MSRGGVYVAHNEPQPSSKLPLKVASVDLVQSGSTVSLDARELVRSGSDSAVQTGLRWACYITCMYIPGLPTP